MEDFNELTASVKALPMPKGLYRFSVSSVEPRIVGDDHPIALPAFQVGPCPGVPLDDVKIMSSPSANGGWLCNQRDDIILEVKAPTVLLLTSVRAQDLTPLEIEVEQLDPRGMETAAAEPGISSGASLSDASSDSLNEPVMLVEHPAWRDVRDNILAAAAAGPATLAVLGSAGTGKTLLLRDLAVAFRQRGLSVTLVRQGEMPFDLQPAGVVLIDEASRMDADRLSQVADQTEGLLVLAGPPEFSSQLNVLPRPPIVIQLRPLRAREVGAFVTAWLEHLSVPAGIVTGEAMEQLIVRSGCIPRLITQILGYTLATASAAGKTSIDASDIDESADVRIWAVESEPVPIPELTPAPSQPNDPGPSLPAWGIAANDALSSEAAPMAPAAPSNSAAAHDGLGVPTARRRSRSTRVRYAAAASFALAAIIALMGVLTGNSAQSRAPAQYAQANASPVIKLGIQPGAGAMLPDDSAAQLAMISPPTTEPLAEMPRRGAEPGKSVSAPSAPPGLMLVARAGDTLQTLYARVYHGVRPPPYADVAAANPVPLGPGVVVVFPAPPDGWVQRVGLR